MIELKEVSKNYGKIEALKDVTLNIGSGVTGLIGPNGAGKSTLVKIILGLIKPSKGHVGVFGMDPWVDGKEVRRCIGMLHEKPVFPTWATGKELLMLVGKLRGLTDLEAEVNDSLRLVDIWDARNRKIVEYSAGMTQRLGVAQAIIGRPKLIILDEPTANLDPKARVEVLEIVKKVKETAGSSFIISTHVLTELEKVCEHVVIMDGGRVIDKGCVEELASKHKAYSLTIKSEKPIILFNWLRNLSYVTDVTLRNNEITVNTSDARLLINEISNVKESNILHIIENPGLLERIYLKVTEKE